MALIELAGGYRNSDLKNYFTEIGISLPNIVSVSVNGAVNSPSTRDSADSEVLLDLELLAAI